MKYFLMPIIGLFLSLAPLLAQDDDNNPDMPTKEEILERVKYSIERRKHQWIHEYFPARNSTYIRTKHITKTGHEIERSTNKMSALTGLHYDYCLSFAHYPVEYRIIDGTATLWSLMYRVYPYMKDKLPKEIDYTEHMGLSVSCNLKKETLEASFRSSIGFDGVPMEVFERVEAEIFENGVRMDFDVEDFIRRSCGSTGYAGGISFNPTKYKEELWTKVADWYTDKRYPLIIHATKSQSFNDRHRTLLQDIIMQNLSFEGSEVNWDKYTFRYYQPPYIYRTLVDIGVGEYRAPRNMGYIYRDGESSCLMFPDDERIFPPQQNTSALPLQGKRYYQILFNPRYIAHHSDEKFAVELGARLCQVYIAYELAIEGRIIPSVKAHLDSVNWYDGHFVDLLAYYAKVKGLSLEELKATYVREQTEILSKVLYGTPPKYLEHLLWQTLGVDK